MLLKKCSIWTLMAVVTLIGASQSTVLAQEVSVAPGFNSGPLVFIQEPFQDDFNDEEYLDRWSPCCPALDSNFPSQSGGFVTLDTDVVISPSDPSETGVTLGSNAFFDETSYNIQVTMIPVLITGQGVLGINTKWEIFSLSVTQLSPGSGKAKLEGMAQIVEKPVSFNIGDSLDFVADVDLEYPGNIRGRIFRNSQIIFDETITGFSQDLPYSLVIFIRREIGGRTVVLVDKMTSSLTAIGYLSKMTPLRFGEIDYKDIPVSPAPYNIGTIILAPPLIAGAPWFTFVDDTFIPYFDFDGTVNINAALLSAPEETGVTIYTTLTEDELESFIPISPDAFCEEVYTAQGLGIIIHLV